MGRPTRRRPSRNGKSTKVSNAQNARDARGVGYEEGPPPVPGSVPAAGGGAAASPASPRSPSILGRHLVNQGPAIGVLFAAAVVGGAGGGLEVPRTDLSSGSEPHHLGRTPGTLTSQLGGADRDDDVTMEQTKTPRQEMGLVEARGGHQEKNWAERSQPAMPWTNSLEAARHRCPRHRIRDACTGPWAQTPNTWIPRSKAGWHATTAGDPAARAHQPLALGRGPQMAKPCLPPAEDRDRPHVPTTKRANREGNDLRAPGEAGGEGAVRDPRRRKPCRPCA